jgi:hypothetical protein
MDLVDDLADVWAIFGDAGPELIEAAAAARPAVLRSAVARPEALFSWSRLNAVLRADELDWVHPHAEGGGLRHRLALFRGGRAVDPASLFRRQLSPRQQPTYAVDPDRLADELRRGGTFVIRDLDREDPEVLAVAEALEAVFRAPVMGGVFASWGDETGFDLHWDGMDNVAIQVAGRRHWTLWAPSSPVPVAGMPLPPPEGPGDLSVTLHAGDALFFPRGWWHRPEGEGEPAMHLTFGIYRRTGLDLVRWLCDQARVGEDGTITFTRDLRALDAGIIDEYLGADGGRPLRNRVTFDLPTIDAGRNL